MCPPTSKRAPPSSSSSSPSTSIIIIIICPRTDVVLQHLQRFSLLTQELSSACCLVCIVMLQSVDVFHLAQAQPEVTLLTRQTPREGTPKLAIGAQIGQREQIMPQIMRLIHDSVLRMKVTRKRETPPLFVRYTGSIYCGPCGPFVACL